MGMGILRNGSGGFDFNELTELNNDINKHKIFGVNSLVSNIFSTVRLTVYFNQE